MQQQPVAAAIRHFRDGANTTSVSQIKNREHFVAEPFEKVKHLVTKEVV
jgi:NADH-quinone oxidoreductase subunit F